MACVVLICSASCSGSRASPWRDPAELRARPPAGINAPAAPAAAVSAGPAAPLRDDAPDDADLARCWDAVAGAASGGTPPAAVDCCRWGNSRASCDADALLVAGGSVRSVLASSSTVKPARVEELRLAATAGRRTAGARQGVPAHRHTCIFEHVKLRPSAAAATHGSLACPFPCRHAPSTSSSSQARCRSAARQPAPLSLITATKPLTALCGHCCTSVIGHGTGYGWWWQALCMYIGTDGVVRAATAFAYMWALAACLCLPHARSRRGCFATPCGCCQCCQCWSASGMCQGSRLCPLVLGCLKRRAGGERGLVGRPGKRV